MSRQKYNFEYQLGFPKMQQDFFQDEHVSLND